MSAPCPAWAEDRSGFVDDALAAPTRERLLSHLADCEPCRTDISQQRVLRRMLSHASTPPLESPQALASRLTSIAGQQAHDPLWTRPFRRTKPGTLPSFHRRRQRQLTGSVLIAGGLLSIIAVLGYVAAPPLNLRPVVDPARGARAQFSASLGQLPLSSDAVAAVAMADPSNTGGEHNAPPNSLTVQPAGSRLEAAAVTEQLNRAVTAERRVSFRGGQFVWAKRRGQVVEATVGVEANAGQGSQLSVAGRGGRPVLTAFSGQDASLPSVQADVLQGLRSNYAWTGWTGAVVAGRAANVVDARVAEHQSEHLAARLWVDQETGLVLRQEWYGPSGEVTLAAGFDWVKLSASDGFITHLAPRLTATTVSSLTASTPDAATPPAWAVQDRVAGLRLVQMQTNQVEQPTTVHLVYSDGLDTVVVVQNRGALSAMEEGTHWDAQLKAYVGGGVARTATWQSGGTVLSVVTYGSPALLAEVVQSLPHADPWTRTTMERVQVGWLRIIDSAIG